MTSPPARRVWRIDLLTGEGTRSMYDITCNNAVADDYRGDPELEVVELTAEEVRAHVRDQASLQAQAAVLKRRASRRAHNALRKVGW